MSGHITLTVQKLVDIGWNFSMDTKNLGLLIVKLTVLSLKYVNKQRLWDALFKESQNNHVDWSVIKPDFNAFKDLSYWITLLEQCQWDAKTLSNHPILTHMKKSMTESGIDSKDMNLVCQLLILHLIQGIPVLYAFELMISRKFNTNTKHSSAVLLANLSNVLFTPEEYEAVLEEILHENRLKIHTELFQSKLDLINAQQETIRTLSKNSLDKYNASGRPRLRDLLEFSTEDKTNMDTKLGTWESYVSFCQLHQFPNILNEVTKQKLYFLVSQNKWKWEDYIVRVVGHDGELASKLVEYPVTKPDIDVLHFCIQRLNMDGKPPFKELLLFKNKCFINFPLSMFQTMNLTQFLRLYTCIYQNENIWKDLWKQQNVLFSPQVIKDCEFFTVQHPFLAEEFMRFFL